MEIEENAVLGDQDLQDALNQVSPVFGDLCVRVAGEVWGKPLVPQKTKAFLAIVLDVSHQSYSGPGIPFEAHVLMALKHTANGAIVTVLDICSRILNIADDVMSTGDLPPFK